MQGSGSRTRVVFEILKVWKDLRRCCKCRSEWPSIMMEGRAFLRCNSRKRFSVNISFAVF